MDVRLSAQVAQAIAPIGVYANTYPTPINGYLYFQTTDNVISQFHQSALHSVQQPLVMAPMVMTPPLYSCSFSSDLNVTSSDNQVFSSQIPFRRQEYDHSKEMAKVDRVRKLGEQIQKNEKKYQQILKEKETANASNIMQLQMDEEKVLQKLTKSRRNLAQYKAQLSTDTRDT